MSTQMELMKVTAWSLAEVERLRALLERCKTVLGNMALENEEHPTMGYLFKARWPISHEPLRADARGLLPVIEDALNRHAHTQRVTQGE